MNRELEHLPSQELYIQTFCDLTDRAVAARTDITSGLLTPEEIEAGLEMHEIDNAADTLLEGLSDDELNTFLARPALRTVIKLPGEELVDVQGAITTFAADSTELLDGFELKAVGYEGANHKPMVVFSRVIEHEGYDFGQMIKLVLTDTGLQAMPFAAPASEVVPSGLVPPEPPTLDTNEVLDRMRQYAEALERANKLSVSRLRKLLYLPTKPSA